MSPGRAPNSSGLVQPARKVYRPDGYVNVVAIERWRERTDLLTTKPRGRPSSRARILKAADELAREIGPGHISLDAVAERAGISKGGLLYNFPNKASLLKAMVAEHLKDVETSFDAVRANRPCAASSMLHFLIDRAREAMRCTKKSPIGFLAAVAENPELLEPVRAFHKKLVSALREADGNTASILVIYLALEGLRSLELMETDSLTADERVAVLALLGQMASRIGGEPRIGPPSPG